MGCFELIRSWVCIGVVGIVVGIVVADSVDIVAAPHLLLLPVPQPVYFVF